MRWCERDGVKWLEAELPGGRAVFTTRVGGVSAHPYAELNLGWLTGDDSGRVAANRERLAEALGIDPAALLTGLQVHGDELARHTGPLPESGVERPEAPAEADGHATATPGLAPMVVVADCLPVALAGPGGIAMLHCGWRGLAGRLIERGVRAVGATAAAIGPGIGACCYEVGDEVRGAFAALGPGITRGRQLDLAEVAERKLAAAGVERVERAGLCTSCNEALFFSHRRDAGDTGRQAGIAELWPS